MRLASLLLSGLAVSGLVAATTLPSSAAAFESAAAVKSRIDIAGKQRMLTQRMTKAACMLHVEVDPTKHQKQLADAYFLFDRSLLALSRGDRDLGLVPEKSKRVVHHLEKVRKLWVPMQVALLPAAQGKPLSDMAFDYAVEGNLALLKEMHRTVGVISRTHKTSATDFESNRAVNFAGAQRMLSQRIAKDYCLIAAGIDVENTRIDLFASIALFDKRQKQLIEGDKTGKVAPPTSAAKQALLEASAAWEPLRAEALKLQGGAEPTPEGLKIVAEAADELLKRAHAAVQVIEEGVSPQG
ncbi:MAG: type IV pili methyl-accepting chemotaxis transducer N-terminal domain-containing protein [Pseudomonadota bacterium]